MSHTMYGIILYIVFKNKTDTFSMNSLNAKHEYICVGSVLSSTFLIYRLKDKCF